MLPIYRSISLLEGLSFLAILSVTFGLVSREFVFYLGVAHGVLFMLYLVFSLLVSNQQGWSLKVWLPLFFAAFVPLAFIPVELFLKKSIEEPALAIS